MAAATRGSFVQPYKCVGATDDHELYILETEYGALPA